MVETKAKRPTDSLTEDHIAVVAQLNRLRDAGNKLTSLSQVQVDEAHQVIGEVIAFLDKELELHLRKEEEALFPPLEAIIGANGGPIAVMRYEHDDLRAKTRELKKLAGNASQTEGAEQNIHRLQGTISFIYNLLTQHIHKEDYILFPMADHALSPEDIEKVAAKFHELEAGNLS